MLLTKLFIPEPSEDTIHRQGLFDILDQAHTKKIVLVSAPAGYGKTTVISDWIARHNFAAVWCAFDNRDNNPFDFLKLIVFAIHRKNEAIGKNVLELLQSTGSTSIDYILELLINDLLLLEKEMVLVLDDLHLIKQPQVYEVLSTLINYKPANLKLVISTRSDPPLSFSRLRSQGEIVEIRAKDLSFSKKDISFLFNRKLKVKLSDNDLSMLAQKTEGWIAGLQLTAITVKGQNDISAYLKKMAGDNRYIMDYLVDEVLHNQPDELKNFLLKTSLFDQFNASLCDRILKINNSQQILEKFENDNLFIVPLDYEKQWFRYHHLFGDLLKHHLKNEFKSEIEELHLIASEWFLDNNQIVESIEHAFKALRSDKAIKILNEHVESLWTNGDHAIIHKFGEQLSKDQIISNPRFSIFYSWMLIMAGRINRAKEYLDETEKILLKQAEKEENIVDLKGKFAITLAYLNAVLGRKTQVLKYSDEAVKYLSDNNPLWNGWAYVAFGDAYLMNANLDESLNAYTLAVDYAKKAQNRYLEIIAYFKWAFCYGRHGKYKMAFKICHEQLDLYRDQEKELQAFEHYLCGLYSLYGGILLEWNELNEAKEYIEKGFELSKKANDISFKVYSYVAMIHLNFSMGNYDKAEALLDELEEDPAFVQTTSWLSIHITAWKAELLMQKGELEKAAELLLPFEKNLGEEIVRKPEYILLRLAKLYLLQHQSEKALKMLEELAAQANEYDKYYSKFYVLTLKAAACHELNKKEKAKATLIKAIHLAQEEDYTRLFIDDRALFQNLLVEIQEERKIKSSEALNRISDAYFRKLMQAIENDIKNLKPKPDGGLSSRELETLVLIARDLTNQEIADQLFISLNTVKTRLKNINLKLDVDNRRKAVKKAKELGIL